MNRGIERARFATLIVVCVAVLATTAAARISTTTSATNTTRTVRRFVDPDGLICPGLRGPGGRGAAGILAGPRRGLPVAQFSHPDRTALCRTTTTTTTTTGRIVEPVEVAR